MAGLRFGSVCSGIESASAAWLPLGWEAAWLAEIDPFANAVLAHHYPAVPNLGDITSADFVARARAAGPIDVLVGGTPCTGFSSAGRREGLADPRSALAIRFVEIAAALRPAWVVWENVPGCLSSAGGRDFGAFLGQVADLGGRWAYRVLDARFFGVPQRRRRVFLVASLGAGDPGQVLFEPDGEGRDPAAGGEAGADAAGSAPAGPGGVACVAYLEPRLCRGSTTHNAVGIKDGSLSDTLQAADGVGGVAVVAYQQHGSSVDPMGTLRRGNGSVQSGVPFVAVNLMGANRRADRPEGGLYVEADATVSKCLDGTGLNPACGQGGTAVVAEVAGGEGVTHPLTAEGHDASEDGTGRGVRIVAFSCKDSGADVGEVAPTLRGMVHRETHANGGGQIAVAFGRNNTAGPIDTAACLSAKGGTGRLDFETETLLDEQRLGSSGGTETLAVAALDVYNQRLTPENPSLWAGQRGHTGSPNAVVIGGDPTVTPIDMRQASRGERLTNNRRPESSGGPPGTGIGEAGGDCPTLAGSHTPAVAVTPCGDVAGTLTPGESRASGNAASPNVLYYSHDYNQDRVYGDTGPTPALTAADSNRTRNHLIAGTVRRLTPTECERLQGFPDGYTLVPHRGRPAADGPRYRALGNAIAVPVLRWIGARLGAEHGRVTA